MFAGIIWSQTSWEITPNQFVMEPKQVRNIKVYFNPRKVDLEELRDACIDDIGTLRIIYGDAPTLLRIRRFNQVLTILMLLIILEFQSFQTKLDYKKMIFR